ncbi:MAG: hypothetical protein ACOCRK_09610 [bacterium]
MFINFGEKIGVLKMTRLHKKNIMQVCKKYFDIYFNHRNLEGIKELIG